MNCIICFKNFDNNFKPLEPCKHYVHKSCIIKLGYIYPDCPICQIKIKISRKYKRKVRRTYYSYIADLFVEQEIIEFRKKLDDVNFHIIM